MKRKTVSWADDSSKFEQVRSVLRDRDVVEVVKILHSLSLVEVRSLLRQDEGKIIATTIKLAYHSIKHNNYKAEHFGDLYSIFNNADSEYFAKIILSASMAIKKMHTDRRLPELFVIYEHINDVSSKDKASSHNGTKVETDAPAALTVDSSELTASDISLGSVQESAAKNTSVTALNSSADTQVSFADSNDHATTHCDVFTDQSSKTEYTLHATFTSSDYEQSWAFVNHGTIHAESRSGESFTNLNYIFSFFFSWLNNLPFVIQESIKQGSAFQVFLEHLDEMQSMLAVTRNKILIPSAANVIEKTQSVNYDDGDVDSEKAADIKSDQNLFIDTNVILDPSFLFILPIMTLSGVDLPDKFE